MLPPADPAELAHRCVSALWERDRASRSLGMRVEEVGPGRAVVAMRVRDDMVNGHAVCHGGYVTALADSAFAFAASTHGEVTVAAGFDVVFVAAAAAGDELVAEARERARYRRSGLYDVTVRRRDATGSTDLVAEVRARSRSLGRPVLADP